jgi:hypothetical protein
MVAADSVRVGDFIRDLGVVLNIRVFATEVANDRCGTLTGKEPYWQIIAEAQKSCFRQVPDRVVIETTGGCRSFYNETLVDVVSLPTALKAAA